MALLPPFYNGDMTREKLTGEDLDAQLLGLPTWIVKNEKLHREYKFPDFALAMGFMAAAAIRIEKLDHHPEWFNVYNRVSIDLTTHDAGGITRRDIELARLLEDIARKLV